MRVVAQFNPTSLPIFTPTSPLIPSGTFNAQFGSGKGRIVVYNKSFLDLLLTFSDGDTFIVRAGQGDLIEKDLPKWIVNWVATNTNGVAASYLVNVNGPISVQFQQVTVVAYQPSELIPETFPVAVPIAFPPAQIQLNMSGQVFSLINNQTVSVIGNFPTSVFYSKTSLQSVGVIFYNIFCDADANAPIVWKGFITSTDPAYTNNILTNAFSRNAQAQTQAPLASITERHTTIAEPTGGANFQKTAGVNQIIDLLDGIPFIIPFGFQASAGQTGVGITAFAQNGAATAMDYTVTFVFAELVNF